jgi:hypothetical protein
MEDDACLACPVRGSCCFIEITIDGTRIVTGVPCCDHLDEETGLCKVFDRRFDANPDCLPIEKMLEYRTVPVECLYVTDKEKYRQETDRRHYHFKVIVED